ncbi:hypothetical protein V6N11_041188 [Hibiscus sabdariffa]|uniref:Uncharacterized protein n=1 Tax=Hibiscus sabdariffa TaxID=183260 RepID=A0ABR2RJR8_9ROSI
MSKELSDLHNSVLDEIFPVQNFEEHGFVLHGDGIGLGVRNAEILALLSTAHASLNSYSYLSNCLQRAARTSLIRRGHEGATCSWGIVGETRGLAPPALRFDPRCGQTAPPDHMLLAPFSQHKVT